jgi:CubicO group peptidase (beta-lactamase class C family)
MSEPAATTRRGFLHRTAMLASALSTAAVGTTGCSAGTIGGYLNQAVPTGAALTVLAARDRKIAYHHGFGPADKTTGGDTVYDIGSVTKQFTAAAVLTLEMTGKLSISDRIGSILHGIRPDKGGITLHHLLTHTSGLIDTLGDDYAPLSRQAFLEAVSASKLSWAPGAGYRYSNVGYAMLAVVIEHVSGVSYETYLAEHLFSPAGMTDTGYLLPRWNADRVAMQYDARGRPKGKPNSLPWAADGPYWNLRGNGGLLSTAPDLFRWHVALDGTQILSTRMKQRMFSPHVREEPDGDTYYGYGWVLAQDNDGRRIAWHNGGNQWSYCELARCLDQDAMVFWSTNQVRQTGRWNLEDRDLTTQILRRLDD